MAKKVRFPLQMNGADVRTIEELREHFDLESVLGYFANGKLTTWLRDRYYDNEATTIEALSTDDAELNQKIMAALGVSVDTTQEIDIEAIQYRNEKLMKLRQFTDNQEIINNVDYVAFNQDDLLDILDEGAEKIYLCEGEFNIPLSVKNVTYIGIKDPIVLLRAYDNVNFVSLNIKLENICFGWDISSTTSNDRLYQAERLLEKCEFDTAIPILEQLVAEKNPRAFNILGSIYEIVFKSEENSKKSSDLYAQAAEFGFSFAWIEKNRDFTRMKELLIKLADKGDKTAMSYLSLLFALSGNLDDVIKYSLMGAEKNDMSSCACLYYLYKNAFFTGKIPDNLVDINKSLFYGDKAAKLGYADITNKMALTYWAGDDGVGVNYEKAVYYWEIGAKNGNHDAQYYLACCYDNGYGVQKDYNKAFYWYDKAVSTGSIDAKTLLELGQHYMLGWGTEINYKKAFICLEKAANAGNNVAQNQLRWLYQTGNGVPQDYNLALYWYEKAGENGLAQGKENAQIIRNEMNRCSIDTSPLDELRARQKQISDEFKREYSSITDELRKEGFFNLCD